MLSAGNLTTTQQVIKRINADLNNNVSPNLFTVNSIQEAVYYIASVNTAVTNVHVIRDAGSSSFEITFILAGKIGNT